MWVQVEAQPTLVRGQNRARDYAQVVPNVNGFAIGSGWYVIALGPFAPETALNVLEVLRGKRSIPADSYIVDGSQFLQQFWPVGATLDQRPAPVTTTPVVTVPDTSTVARPAAEPLMIPDETISQARASEAVLDRSEREALQIALQWAGFYNSSIDGAFGRGTRGAMSDWQAANGYEPTGILTSLQRGHLLSDYNAVLDGMNMELVRDDATGIEIEVPSGLVSFAAYAPPFARFEATSDLDATVLLISQPGDQTRLFGLYEILQTLEIVPPDGPRGRDNDSFFIEGIDRDRHTYITASLSDGAIKGFALVWPEGDEARRDRILDIMQASFAINEGVLDPGLSSPGEEQTVDLISGLAIRQPILSRSGFYIDAEGTVLTTLEAVEACGEVVLDGTHVARVVHRDDQLGLAVLRTDDKISPLDVATFQSGTPRLQSEVAVAGYPYGGLLAAPAVTFGTLADLQGLNGEQDVKRLSILTQPGDAGGPVLDNGGAVLGMLLPKNPRNGQVLPAEVSYSINANTIGASLDAAGIKYQTTSSVQAVTPELLTREAGDLTVLVSCWE